MTPGKQLDVKVVLDEKQSAKERIGKAGGNLLLTSADGSKFTLDVPPNALVSPGGTTRVVTATFTMDLPDSDAINCAGRALAPATGLSFSVPKNGPLADVPVTWEVVASGATEMLAVPVYIAAKDNKSVGKQVTNSAGESSLVLTGMPQKINMTHLPVVPLAKRVDLRLSIAMNFL